MYSTTWSWAVVRTRYYGAHLSLTYEDKGWTEGWTFLLIGLWDTRRIGLYIRYKDPFKKNQAMRRFEMTEQMKMTKE